MNWRIWIRRSHRWGSLLIAAPFLVVLLSGLLLQLKKNWSWIQPPTQRGSVSNAPAIDWATLLNAARSVSETTVKDWADIDRLDVRPERGIVKVQTKDRWEIQIDLGSGEVLQTAYRRSDLIESIHDGSWFHESARLGVFLPSAIVVLGLWVTGLALFFLPIWTKRTNRRRRERDRQRLGVGKMRPTNGAAPIRID